DRRARLVQLDEIETKAMARVARHRTVLDIPARVLQRAHAAVADVLDERRLVEERQDERRVRGREIAQTETRRVELHRTRMPKRAAVSPSKSISMSTAGSLPTTQPSCPGSIATTCGATNSAMVPSRYSTWIRPRAMKPTCACMQSGVPTFSFMWVDQRN